jgi:integrase/recombinase XerD
MPRTLPTALSQCARGARQPAAGHRRPGEPSVADAIVRGKPAGGRMRSSPGMRGFVVEVCPRLGRRAAQLTVVALRSLLRFLHLEGELERSLAGAVPSVYGSRLSGLPKRLEREQVDALLESCDRSTVVGVRDLAILTVLARLGLRAGEVAGLSLEDIDWRAGEIVVCGKGGRSERLPLPVDVGEAIVGYLRDGRPVSAQDRAVFVRVRAPHHRLSPGGVTYVVEAAALRAGLGQIRVHGQERSDERAT